MRRTACVTLGLIVGIGLAASPVQAQVITGPEVSHKINKVPVEGALDLLGAGLEWLSWSGDEAVERLVYEPIKLLGMERFGSQTAALKTEMTRAETRVRATVTAFDVEELEAGPAMRSMDEAVNEFRSAVGELLEAR